MFSLSSPDSKSINACLNLQPVYIYAICMGVGRDLRVGGGGGGVYD